MTSSLPKAKDFRFGLSPEWNEEITGFVQRLKQLFLIMKSQQNILFAGMFRGVLSLFMVRKNATNAKCRCNNRNWMCDTRRNKTF
jgi:hypothetical protein